MAELFNKIVDKVLGRLHLTKYKQVLLYLFFGVLTTVVDWAVSFLLYDVWAEAMESSPWIIHFANVIAWTCAVLFAFFTNRGLVFGSTRRGFLPVLSELGLFAAGRVATLLMQEAIVAVMFDWLGFNKYAVKIVAAVVVVITNYFISKFIVFRKKQNNAAGEGKRDD